MKILYIKKNAFFSLAIVVAAVLIMVFIGSPAVVGAVAANRQLPIYCVDKQEKIASLSFDAAWGNEDTQEIINILAKYNVKVTFFVVGDWVTKYPESVKALSDAGHEIMNHSNKHKHMPQLSRDDIISDTTSCNQKIEAITGVSPTLFRPPYGDYDDKLITTLRGMGIYTIQWDVDSLDWKELSAPEITQRVLSRVKPGSIVLFHNAALHTPEALPAILDKLTADGYQLVPISQLIYTGDFTIDHEGRQHSQQKKNS